MAITKTIEIDVNSQDATNGINNITNSIEQTDKATQSLRSQLRQAQADVAELSDKFGATSKEAIEAAKRAGQLKDAIGDAKSLTDAFNPDAKFSALSGSLSGVASGFSAVEGSLALAGVQSENLQETMVRLQAAMALSQGLQGLGESIDSFKQMGAVAKNALAGIRTGIAATGIGLLLVALGAIVAYWDDIKEAVGGVSSEQETLNQQSQTNLDIEQQKLDTIGSQDNVLKLQGKSEKEILKIKLAQTDQVIKASEIQIEQSIATAKAQTEAAKRNQEILAGVLKFLSLPLTMILKTVDAVGAALGKDFGLEDKVFKGLASFVFDPKETQQEGDKVVAEQRKALDKLKNDRAGLQLSINNIDKQASKEASDRRKEAADKSKEAKDKALQDEIDVLNEQSKILAQGREIAKANDEKRLEDLKAFGEKKTEELNNQLAQQEAIRQKELENEQVLSDGKKAIQESSFAVVESGLGLLKTLFEKNKGLQKAALIAESAIGISKIVINTQAANAAARLKYALIPGGAALAAAEITLNRIGAGIGIATNIAATAKGLSALGGGSAKGGSANGGDTGGGAPSIASPSFNVVGNSGVNQIAQTLGAQQPVQAYVVANNVTTQQALDRNIVRNASIG
jgi:hypothetical protein